MAVAAVTPRVRAIVICEDVIESAMERGVFTLEGVRHHLGANLFPWSKALSLFLYLSNPRKGKYSGKILIVNERTDQPIRYVKFSAAFEVENEMLPLYVELGDCVFPEPGRYSLEVYFAVRGGGEALKGEQPFFVVSHAE